MNILHKLVQGSKYPVIYSDIQYVQFKKYEKGENPMKCQNCGHENRGGRFCENCGTPLVESTENTIQNQQPQPAPVVSSGNTGASQAEDYLKKTKDQSKQYITYFIDVLKRPYASLNAPLENQHFVHAIITIVLYSLFIPLISYFLIKEASEGINRMNPFGGYGSNDYTVPFTDIVLKPFFAFAIFIVLLIALTFISIKLGRVNVKFKEVLTRFGTLLIPFVFILAIGVIFSILKVSLFSLLLMGIGLTGAIYIVVPVLIAFYKKNSAGEGLDVVYGTLLTYILMVIVLLITGEMLFESLLSGIMDRVN